VWWPVMWCPYHIIKMPLARFFWRIPYAYLK
jgi:hypothetical protein